jgi:hypothetical protein
MNTRSARWYVGMLLLFGIVTATDAAADLQQVFPWTSLGSPARDLIIRDHLAYVTTDRGLTIVDLTNPEAPRKRGELTNLGIRGLGIALAWPYAYVANQSRDLQIIDVADADAPRLVVTKSLPGGAWDVALKDQRGAGGRLIAYVASFGGEVYVVDVTDHTTPQQIKVLKVLGLPAWAGAGGDAGALDKLNAHATSGNGKVTGLSVEGDDLVIVEWAYGRAYHYNVPDAANPTFAGTHYAPFTFRVKVDPTTRTAYMLSAYGTVSGIYSLPLPIPGPTFSTRHETCPACGYVSAPRTDFGALGLTASGKYAMYIAGTYGVVRVVDITDPTNMQIVGSANIPFHYAGTALTMGVAQYGDYIIAAGARLGLGVFKFPGLSQ